MWLLILLLLCLVSIVLATTKLRLHPFIALLIATFASGLLCDRISLKKAVASTKEGFSSTIGYTATVILAGAIIGT